ncbi:DUF1659 domain-containing protein [Mesobacillus zeae]
MRLLFEAGMDVNGKTIFKGKIYSNIRKEATASQVQQAAEALASLSGYSLSSVERTDNFDIVL